MQKCGGIVIGARYRWLAAAATFGLAAVAAGVLAPPRHPATVPEAWAMASADDGARIAKTDWIDERTVDLTIESPALGRQGMVRLLLPARFDAEPARRWPVLFLLHGADEPESYRSWTSKTDVESFTRDMDLIVVMPEAGMWGFYADWWNDGTGGAPRWETFHLTEVREIVERNFRAGDGRVIAGLSMGGFGAMSYAARHPDLFLGAASFSGVLDLADEQTQGIVDPRTFGDPAAQAAVWRAHDPCMLAPALRGKTLYVAYGDGDPGPLDPSGAAHDALEARLAGQNEAFVARLHDLGIPATIDAYGAGTHSWPYWQRGLHAALPLLLAALDR